MVSVNSTSLQENKFCVQTRNLKKSLLTTRITVLTRIQGVRQKRYNCGAEVTMTIESKFPGCLKFFFFPIYSRKSRILIHSCSISNCSS